MIYRFTFLSDEAEHFKRVFEIDSEATFFDLHKVILASAGYSDDQMTSFFICNDRWEKEQEVTLVEMESNYEYDNMVMEDTRLSELLTETHQKLLYVFDPMFERAFFGELTAMEAGKYADEAICTLSEGKAPKQLQTEDAIIAKAANLDIDEDFYGDSQYDTDELDPEGFGDMNFDDSSLF
ncbi:MAG: plasmid pRiA4b ORF-3 family protein [Paludibacter sp.]|nr:plasmid pRiA4b ORF-3 family protein [Bacteroidales bacterium]MCM1069359.1 plasmid pRiA4b ORF-3 family protein [Prevotella sp.]MCM1353879.1 plasmid pRiA4b ORF-3 family protein [Bacteroides sp.]MCM1442871.1 plasmid pRiA4b ORF-3 family protein [Muribaculum sp.]MCM1481916.1 plasmid pRiA4b ORF-3 family protein [Paludibacter sp.]